MKKIILLVLAISTGFWITGCNARKTEGVITYNLSYKLPDSAAGYLVYLPKTAKIYFKGDSAAVVQGTDQEFTTILTHQPTGSMVSLFKSGFKKIEIVFDAQEQKKELPDLSEFEFIKTAVMKTVAGFKAEKYTVKSKFSGDTTSAWFTHDLDVPSNFLTMGFKPEMGTPLIFSTDQNGFVTTATISDVKYEKAPAGIFAVPAGYTKLTPQQFRELPAGN